MIEAGNAIFSATKDRAQKYAFYTGCFALQQQIAVCWHN
jgi:hypothetical protein